MRINKNNLFQAFLEYSRDNNYFDYEDAVDVSASIDQAKHDFLRGYFQPYIEMLENDLLEDQENRDAARLLRYMKKNNKV